MSNNWANFLGFFTGSTAELLAYKNLNKQGEYSGVKAFPNYGVFLTGLETGGFVASEFVMGIVSILRNWHFSKYEYNQEGKKDKLDFEHLELLMFLYGRVMIWREPGGKMMITGYAPQDYDAFMNVKTVKPILMNKDKNTIKKIFTVGKNCVIAYHSFSWLYGKEFLGPLFFAWSLIGDLATTYYHINSNIHINRSMIMVPLKTGQDEVLNLEMIVQGNQHVIPMVDEIFTKDPEGKIFQNERTEELWKNFDNIFTHIKLKFGIQGNPNEKKERMIYKEVAVNEQLTIAQLEVEMRRRKEMVEAIKDVFNVKITVKERENLIDKTIEAEAESKSQGGKSYAKR